jgi:RHS repeat-associated protein
MVMLSVLIIQQGQGQSILPDDYAYDWNGSLVRDLNKDIADIHYNVLNLPDTITYADGRKIVYVYTASGQKVCQQVLDAAGATTVRRDYTGGLLYENGTLQHLLHEQGRVVWKGGSPEYQYHLTDHLGNVRTTLTSAPETTEYLATMESEKAEGEEMYFSGMHARSLYTAANHTAGGNEVLNVGPGVARTASLGLAVNKGDVVYLEVYAYYENGVVSDDDPQSPSFGSAVTAIASSVNAVGGRLLSAEAGALSPLGAPAALLLPGMDAGTEQTPSAYLNYALFDKHYVMVTGGYRKVTKQGAYAKELLTLGPLEIKQSGYLDVYLSNSGTKYPVYFDDLKVTHVEGPIVQEDSYDPFGMALTGQHGARFDEPANRYLYNGKELQHDHDLNWYDYGARMYDAALGRWHAIDPMAEKYAAWSPYQYTLNNPVKFIDPDGRDVQPILPERNKPSINTDFVRGMLLLGASSEGTRIVDDAANNDKVAVYIAPYEGTLQSNGRSALGLTLEIDSEATDLAFSKDDPFSVFNGVDIEADRAAGKQVYLILVSVDDKAQLLKIAQVVAHEIEAHVNIAIGKKAKIEAFLKSRPNATKEELEKFETDLQHWMYGQASGYTLFSNGVAMGINTGDGPAPGSSADRVSTQLTDMYKRLHNIIEAHLKAEAKRKLKQ